jgi:hypothetical protein
MRRSGRGRGRAAVRLGAPALLAGLLMPGAAHAQAQGEPRPSEADLFGAPAEKPAEPAPAPPKGEPSEGTPPPDGTLPPPPARTEEKRSEEPSAPGHPTAPPAAEAAASRDEAILGDPAASTRLSDEVAPEDPLRIGGQFYLRAQSTAGRSQSPDEWSFSSPTLLDAYLDARPNERVRGFVLGRMQFDPSLPEEGQAGGAGSAAAGAPLEASGSTMGTAPLSSLFGAPTRGPRVALDQLWLRFDLGRRVFVTAGKQHVRWGTGRFWTPTDYLHFRRRNPLDVFDARTGTTMLKLHLPWEERGWNLYGYAVTEGADATSTVGRVSAGGRAEIVLGTTELAAGALVRKGSKPKLGFDASTGLGPFDLYGELALRYGSEIDRVTYDPDATIAPGRPFGELDRAAQEARLREIARTFYPARRRSGLEPQVVGGLTYQQKYNDNDVFTVGAEYFYNALGYASPLVYPGLIIPRDPPLAEPATFFYLGRHYGALFLNVPAPYSWNYTTFTLSTLGNLSDRSFITRFDYSLLLLTHLRFEAFVAVRYGEESGEFRLGARNFGPVPLPARDAALLDLGVALRVAL